MKQNKVTEIVTKAKKIRKCYKEISSLEKKIDNLAREIVKKLSKEINAWKPYKDEMAVCYYPDQGAWYVWFVEELGERYYRFKETPSWEPRIHNYYSQKLPLKESGNFIVLPLNLFQELNYELRLDISNKYEDISK